MNELDQQFSIITYNIHRGLSPFQSRDVSGNIIDSLLEAQVDIACLQEVWQHQGVNQHQLEERCNTFWPHGIFEKNVAFPDGAQGNAILSRFPIVYSKNIRLSFKQFEPRGILHCRLKTPSGLLSVICLHFGLQQEERVEQTERLRVYIESNIPLLEPLIVAGDLNDWNKKLHPILTRNLNVKDVLATKRGRRQGTYPALVPLLSLDRIYYRNLLLERSEVLRGKFWRNHSDHLPVRAAFKSR
jgi:endonuclease/exonuclease/phosphatase family metal-dependent hydrolase